jgi:hypothetical protein
MKTVSIGDTHGTAVADIVLKIINEQDKFIFAGDYVDSIDVDNFSMKKNLKDIIDLKIAYPDKIVLLLGNHDIHYFLGSDYYSSGYRPEMRKDFHEIFHLNSSLFRLAYLEKDYLWTHAGINSWWYENRFRKFAGEYPEASDIAELLNLAFEKRYPALFDVGYIRKGRYETGGPLWCDKSELAEYPFEGINQIVGHNRVKQIQKINKHDKEIALIDILENEEIITEASFFYREI